ncbi:MAG: hypothetical protein NTV86_15885, partial [Planctomycetota bacterium]|nr:hypothetical protein [Planctomycetota bacterium]
MSPQPTDSRPLRVAILAHNSRVAGGLSVGKNLLGAIARQAPQHEYIVTYPPGLGYEGVCAGIPHCHALPCQPRGGMVGLMLYEMFKLGRRLRPHRPEVLLALGNRGLLRPPCPQAIYIQDAHYCYPTRFFARETWKNKFNKRVQTWLITRQLRRSKLLFCQTPVMEKRAKEAFRFRGRTALCPNAVSAFSTAGADNPPMPEAMAPHAGKMRLFYVTRFYGHKNLEGIVDTFARYRDELKDVAVFLTLEAGQHPNAPAFLQSIERQNLGGSLINVGPIPQSALAGYYRHSHALLMPSFLESFSGTYL